MGLSGLVGSGAAKGLEEILTQQLLEARFKEQRRAQQAQEAQNQQRIDLATRNQEFDERNREEDVQQSAIGDMRAQGDKMDARMSRLQGEEDKADQRTRIAGLLKRIPNPAGQLAAELEMDGVNLSAGQLEPPVDREAERKRALGDYEDRKKIDARYRESDEGGQGQVIDTVDADGNPVKRFASRDELKGGVKMAARPRVVTGAERQAKNYYERAAEAHEMVKALEPEVAKMNLGGQARMEYAPNWLQSETGQLYRQSQRAFTEARLRKESGAAIPPHEYDNDSRTYFAQPGDVPAVQAQKRKAREIVLSGIKNEARRAIAEHQTGDPESGGPNEMTFVRDANGKLVKK